MTTWTTAAVLEWTTKRFTDAKIDAARLEAQVLLAHALGCTRVQLYTGFDRPLAEGELTAARELIRRRLAGEPLAAQTLGAYLDVFTHRYLQAKNQLPVDLEDAAHVRLRGLKLSPDGGNVGI